MDTCDNLGYMMLDEDAKVVLSVDIAEILPQSGASISPRSSPSSTQGFETYRSYEAVPRRAYFQPSNLSDTDHLLHLHC
jgi:hypothetical protein